MEQDIEAMQTRHSAELYANQQHVSSLLGELERAETQLAIARSQMATGKPPHAPERALFLERENHILKEKVSVYFI